MKKYFIHAFAFIGALFGFGCTGVSTENIEAVTPFKINSYLGVWYEQARLPHSFEDGIINPKATYSWGRNGLIEVVNEGIVEKTGKRKRVTGVAETYKNSDSGELKVSFFRPFYGKYRIIYLDEKYTDSAPLEYYLNHFDENKLHPNTRRELRWHLEYLAEHGLDLTMSYLAEAITIDKENKKL